MQTDSIIPHRGATLSLQTSVLMTSYVHKDSRTHHLTVPTLDINIREMRAIGGKCIDKGTRPFVGKCIYT